MPIMQSGQIWQQEWYRGSFVCTKPSSLKGEKPFGRRGLFCLRGRRISKREEFSMMDVTKYGIGYYNPPVHEYRL